ncbi:MAG: hypothetical protein JSR82_02045 [Verrucomicrobia bacterium]|nr:hypothetical protein [Verrucomicrobiota bacterium]
MKTRLSLPTSFFTLALVLAGLFLPRAAEASIQGARERAIRIVRVMNSNGVSFRDAAVGILPPGGEKLVSVNLAAGRSYFIVASGCEDAFDVDVMVYDQNNNLVARDNDASTVAVAKVTPRWTGKFYIKVRMHRSTYNGAHYVLLYGSK